MALDLHLHTRGSWDSLSDPVQVLERARSLGIERIAITDHDHLGTALEFAADHPDEIIPGEEVRTAEGVDVIGLYLREEIPRGTPALEVCRRVREQGGLVYLPHPFASGKGGDGRLAESLAPELDVVEVFNARLLRSGPNERALGFARRHGLPGGAGSDAHTVGEVGNARLELPVHPNRPEALLRALAEGVVGGRRAALSAFLQSNAAKVLKKIGVRRESGSRTP